MTGVREAAIRQFPILRRLFVLAIWTAFALSTSSCVFVAAPTIRDFPSRIERFEYTAAGEAGHRVDAMRRRGDGEWRIVLVPGSPGPMRYWSRIVAEARPDLEMVAIERLGFGRSEPRRAVTSLAGHVEALEPLLEHEGGPRVILAGHSYGGPIVAKAAVRYPKRISGLLILAGAFDPELEKILFVQRLGNAWGFRHLIPRLLRNANQELMALEGELRELEPELGTIRTPTVILHGTADKNVPYSNTDYLLEHLSPDAKPEVITLEGANHFMDVLHYEDVQKAIGRTIEKIEEPDRRGEFQ